MKKQILVKQSIGKAWMLFKKNPWFYILGILFTYIIGYALVTIPNFIGSTVADIVFSLLYYAFTLVATLGWMTVVYKAAQGQEPEIKDLTANAKLWWKLLVAGILHGLLTMVGLVLLVIPGIYWAIKYSMFPLALVEDPSRGPVDAMRRSSKLIKGVWWKYFWFLIVTVGVALLGLLALVLGILVAYPVILIASAIVFVALAKQTDAAGSEMPAPGQTEQSAEVAAEAAPDETRTTEENSGENSAQTEEAQM